MFGRRYDITLTRQSGRQIHLIDVKKGVDNLLFTGSLSTYAYGQRNKLQLTVFNLPVDIIGYLEIGYEDPWYITVMYGYEDENTLDLLFTGKVMRAITGKNDNIVDQETTFYCYDSSDFLEYGFYSGTFKANTTFYDIVKTVGLEGSIPININCTNSLKNYKVNAKGLQLYGKQSELLNNIAKACGMTYYLFGGEAFIQDPNNTETDTDIINFTKKDETDRIVSSSGMVGIPQLNSDGLQLKCLVNPKIKPYKVVKVDSTVIAIKQSGYTISRNPGALIDSGNLYRIIEATAKISNDGSKNEMTLKAYSYNAYNSIAKES